MHNWKNHFFVNQSFLFIWKATLYLQLITPSNFWVPPTYVSFPFYVNISYVLVASLHRGLNPASSWFINYIRTLLKSEEFLILLSYVICDYIVGSFAPLFSLLFNNWMRPFLPQGLNWDFLVTLLSIFYSLIDCFQNGIKLFLFQIFKFIHTFCGFFQFTRLIELSMRSIIKKISWNFAII